MGTGIGTSPAAPAAWQRGLAALPDALTCGFFLAIWVAPLAFGEGAVRNAMLMMLVEFVLVHAAGFLGPIMLSETTPIRTRLKTLAGFALFYLLFISAFAWSFGEWWPFAAFGWLLLGKVSGALEGGRQDPQRQRRMQSAWAISALAYMGGVFATLFLPLPQLGINADVVPQLGLTGSGEWVDKPHTVVAFGALYFGVLAWSKWRDWRLQTLPVPRQN